MRLLIFLLILFFSQLVYISIGCCTDVEIEKCNNSDQNCNKDCARAIALSLFSDLFSYQLLYEDLDGKYNSLSDIIILLGEENDINNSLQITLGQVYGYRWLVNLEKGNIDEAATDFDESINRLKKYFDPNLDRETLEYFLKEMKINNLKVMKNKMHKIKNK